jgi:hypothetical protein
MQQGVRAGPCTCKTRRQPQRGQIAAAVASAAAAAAPLPRESASPPTSALHRRLCTGAQRPGRGRGYRGRNHGLMYLQDTGAATRRGQIAAQQQQQQQQHHHHHHHHHRAKAPLPPYPPSPTSAHPARTEIDATLGLNGKPGWGVTALGAGTCALSVVVEVFATRREYVES